MMHISDPALRGFMEAFVRLMEDCEPIDDWWAETLGVAPERVGQIRNVMTIIKPQEMLVVIATCTIVLKDQPGVREATERFWASLAKLKNDYADHADRHAMIAQFEQHFREPETQAAADDGLE